MKHIPVTPALLRAIVEGDPRNIEAALVPGGIEAQEMAGQMEQAALDTLPIKLSPDRTTFEKLGFKFGRKADDLFVEAKFPAGWAKKPTGHSMWTDIVDGAGYRRGNIFYKAAFYDRSAHAHLCARFQVAKHYTRDEPSQVEVVIEDAMGVVDRQLQRFPAPNWRGDRSKAEADEAKISQAVADLEAWLDANHPGWRSPVECWG